MCFLACFSLFEDQWGLVGEVLMRSYFGFWVSLHKLKVEYSSNELSVKSRVMRQPKGISE